ncbi:MAG TPA: sulfate reduction electron transfer complex DsrMKJOP subunit DsrM [Clostridia bacterium]|nr:sulfate reduction electron transfer complex DsrMKJOP subunit DsrM [Clostridia bacterium]
MAIGTSLILTIVLVLLPIAGVAAGGTYLFGVIIPYLAVAVFVAGFIYRIVRWTTTPVPFNIVLSGGQQRSLPWIKQNKLDSPFTTAGVIGRMALEVLCFRSLFRNVKGELREGKLVYRWEKWLWLFGLMFHWSFLIIILRHLRYFTEPVPGFVGGLERLDGMFRFGYQAFYLTDVFFVIAITFLFLRRVVIPQVKYVSLFVDYFPLFLLGSIGISGILMKYVTKVDITAIKELALGLVTFQPVLPAGIDSVFYVHLFLVSTLVAYFPFSKMMHMGGIFLSPTRNLANNCRAVRHINPWNYPVDVHTYEEYEEEFRDKMIAAGIPVEKG